ncbi:hypothetical protein [Streptomyces lutosisoli]|uniref:Uncharacterized protein n=1 Tax=Streptomyces lutosisoli TaxID=2665721 RepID=A0ABW2VZ15_9ACTN
MKTVSRPRHFSRDRPYAAIELTNRPPVTTTNASSSETPMKRQK